MCSWSEAGRLGWAPGTGGPSPQSPGLSCEAPIQPSLGGPSAVGTTGMDMKDRGDSKHLSPEPNLGNDRMGTGAVGGQSTCPGVPGGHGDHSPRPPLPGRAMASPHSSRPLPIPRTAVRHLRSAPPGLLADPPPYRVGGCRETGPTYWPCLQGLCWPEGPPTPPSCRQVDWRPLSLLILRNCWGLGSCVSGAQS